MDEKTLQAMTILTNKLGTTAEHLWGVLIRQAPIAGISSLMTMAAWIVACVLLARHVMRKTRGDEPQWRDELICVFAWAGVCILCIVTALIVSTEFPGAVAALVNPEYWALLQVLKSSN